MKGRIREEVIFGSNLRKKQCMYKYHTWTFPREGCITTQRAWASSVVVILPIESSFFLPKAQNVCSEYRSDFQPSGGFKLMIFIDEKYR